MQPNIKEWIEKNRIKAEVVGNVIKTDLGLMVDISEHVDKVFNKDFDLNIPDIAASLVAQSGAEYYVYEFGGLYYYTPVDKTTKVKLKAFKYFGKSSLIEKEFPYLGVHGKYELMNGTRGYEDWIKKAKFYGIKTLGLCEESTLGGTLAFQIECEKNDIKSIIGAQYKLALSNENTLRIKLYVKNKKGWRNLLRINKIANIDSEDGLIPIESIFEYTEGLICVVDPLGDYDLGKILNTLSKEFREIFVQVDFTELTSNSQDIKKLERLKEYFDKYLYNYTPILISDSYYLDKDDAEIKKLLNRTAGVKNQVRSYDQHFKHLLEIVSQARNLFNPEDTRFKYVIETGVFSCRQVDEMCEFKIETGIRHLPKYEMTEGEFKKYEGDNKKMFLDLINQGIDKSGILKDYPEEVVINRLKKEIKVIVEADVYDYFLILWDIINYAKSKNILSGIGRGSAGGCLISYLLGIIKVNPLDYDLLFERFLNEGRAKKSLPDIDTDFPGSRREEIKKYMEEKYGHNYVASIGTYNTLQIKAAIKELVRATGCETTATINYVTKMIDGSNLDDIFVESQEKPALKEFIKKHGNIINKVPLCYNSPKSSSIHACATIIIPKETDEDGNELDIFDRIPMRKDENGMLVTEWEAEYIEMAGFLKEDILGIRQLDKFEMIFNLIEETTGKRLTLEDIPMNDLYVMGLFKKGFNKDVFHFGSSGLTEYLLDVKPENITELINSIALYRPGAMISEAHTDYVGLKRGELVPEYDFGTEDITKETFGLYIFQEQVMRTCQELGGFTLAESDDIRKAMGKGKADLLKSYKGQFIESATSKGCSLEEAEKIWRKLEVFSGYGFNKSHAAAYSITGYICNWLKYYYPTQFWVSALQYAKDEDVPEYVSEILKSNSGVKIMPPDINNSQTEFTADFDKKEIYWSIGKVKFVGGGAVEEILQERERDGKFYSVEELTQRVEKRLVNKRAMINMILAGCFDSVYGLESIKERQSLIKEFLDKRGEKEIPQELFSQTANAEWFWALKQREVCGLGTMSYEKALEYTSNTKSLKHLYVKPEDFFSEYKHQTFGMIGGILIDIVEKNSKKGKMGVLTLDNNSEIMIIRVWAGEWQSIRKEVLEAKDRILFITGKIVGPSKYNKTSIMQSVHNNYNTTQFEIL